MEKKTEGAWLINHTRKLLDFKGPSEFEEIELAGKCGLFLSNLAASNEESDLNEDKVAAIAKVANIKKTEVDTIKRRLAEARLIDISKNGSVSVLGITTAAVLSHTSDIFQSGNPTPFEKAALDLAENVTDLPKGDKILKEYIRDTYKLKSNETDELVAQGEHIGFVDYEKIDDGSKLYFNGNLFRKLSAQKTNAVLGSLIAEDNRKILELDELLNTAGCVTWETANTILGNSLLSKLQSIGMYDFNEVSNSKETKVMITKPAAFGKFDSSFEDDALDLAKAFVSSLYYGMNFRSGSQGKINSLHLLMTKLVNGGTVGPATAIGEDYSILETRRVVKLTPMPGNSSRFYMRLLKKDIGELALQVLESGNATEKLIESATLQSGSITNYIGPEDKRTMTRKKSTIQSKQAVANLLRTFRS